MEEKQANNTSNKHKNMTWLLREKKLQHTHSHIYTHPCLQLHMHDTQLIKYSYIYMCSEDIKKWNTQYTYTWHTIYLHDTQYIYMTQTTHLHTHRTVVTETYNQVKVCFETYIVT